MSDSRTIMGSAKIGSLLWQFSLPATVGMLVNAAYNIIDRIFIGNSGYLGTDGLAGITISFPIMMILMAIATMCGVGGSTLFSIRLGEKRYEDVKKIVGNAFALAILLMFVIALIMHFTMTPMLVAFGASENVLPYAKEFLSIFLLGAVFQGINMTGNNLIRADGSPKIAMLSLLLSAGVNIILDPIFIYWFRWGMAGAALATVIGMLCSTVWILSYFLNKKRTNFPIQRKYFKLNRKLSLQILSTGTPSFCIQMGGSVLNVVLNATLVKYGGDLAISAMGIVNSIQTLILMPMIGINQGSLPIIGYNFGANKIDRTIETVKLATLASCTIGVIGWIITRVFSNEIIMIFNQDPALVELGSKMVFYWFLALPVIGIGMVGSNFFQSIGKVIPAIFLSLSRQIIMLIPLIILLANWHGLDGLIVASPIADVLSTVLTLILLAINLKKLKNNTLVSKAK